MGAFNEQTSAITGPACVGLGLGWGRGDLNPRNRSDSHDHYDKTFLADDGVRRCRGNRVLINNALF